MAYTSEQLNLTQDVTDADVKQIIDILTPRLYGNSLYNRKDSYTIKLNVYTGGDDLYVLVYGSNNDTPIFVGSVNTDELTECFIDISTSIGVTKYWQVRLVGLLADFKLSSVAIDGEPRPEPVTYFNHILADTGPLKKRIRVWPVTLDTIGEDVIMTPYVDGVAQTPLTCNSTRPETFFYQFKTDVFGVDYSYTLAGACGFEIHKIHEPQGVQVLPIAKQFDQIGAEELFRYGKIKSFIIRVLPIGGTIIPYTLYFEDDEKISGSIDVVSDVEDSYEVNMTKTIAGQILRIEFGPTSFDFHRYYVMLKVAKSGRDTELQWVQVK